MSVPLSPRFPEFADPQVFRAWVREEASEEAIGGVLESRIPSLVEVVLREAPGEWLPQRVLSRLFKEQERSREATPAMLALSSNPRLPEEMQRALVAWAGAALARLVASPEAASGGAMATRFAPIEVLHALEGAGVRVSRHLFQPVRQALHSPERQLPVRSLAAQLLLADWFAIRAEDVERMAEHLAGKAILLDRLYQHPAVPDALLRREFENHLKLRHGNVIGVMLRRPALREDPVVRSLIVRSGDLSSAQALLPYATSEEKVEMVKALCEYGRKEGVSLLHEAPPTPEEFGALLRWFAVQQTSFALHLMEAFGRPELLGQVRPEELLPLFHHPHGEVRLQAQRLWSRGREENVSAEMAGEGSPDESLKRRRGRLPGAR